MKKRQLILGLVSTLSLTSVALAGTPSIETTDITAEIAPVVMVSGLGNIDLQTWSGSTQDGFGGGDRVCLWANVNGNTDTSLITTFKGDGENGAFTLKSTSDPQELLTYTVRFADSDFTPNTEGYSSGINQASYFNCSDDAFPYGGPRGRTENLGIGVSIDEITDHPAGIYKGTLTLTVSIR